MIVAIPQLLPPDLVAGINQALDQAPHTDGMVSAGVYAEGIKRNEELAPTSGEFPRLNEAIHATLRKNNDFQILTIPKVVQPFLFSRYRPGMFYGDHADNAIMGWDAGPKARSDMSLTVFLSDPARYEGGELVLDTDSSPRAFKLRPGDAVLYPTFTLHRVEAVRLGERRAAVTWIQSMVRMPTQRQILVDIALVLNWMLKTLPGRPHEHVEFRRLQKVRSNLERLWAEP
jgi:PKHD-type hydroxylase